MKENNTNIDGMLKQFFDENRREVADNGFSRRVMQHLPNRALRLSKLWSTCCFALALLLFVAFDGLQLTLHTLRETFANTLHSGSVELDPKSLIIACAVLLYVGYRKVSSSMQSW